MRRARWKRKNVRRVGLRQRRPPAAGGGRLAVPRGGQRRKRAALGETFGPGRYRDTSCVSPRCRSRFFEEQPAAAKKEATQCVNHPDAGAPSATGRQLQTRRRPKRARRSGKIGAGTDTPTPVRTEGHRTGVRPAPFSLPPGAAHSLFGQDQKENGGRIPCGSRSLCSIPAPFHRSHKTTSAALSFCGRHRCHFHRSPWTIPLPDLRRKQQSSFAGFRCPGP